MASSPGPWATLPPDLLRLIIDGFGLPLESYSSVRGVCTAWRSALPPPTPLLLAVSGFDAPRHRQLNPGQLMSASFLTAAGYHRSSFRLSELPTGGELVGSSNGWIAVDPVWPGIFLVNPLAAAAAAAGEGCGSEVVLEPVRDGGGEPVVKVAFAPSPTPDDYAAVAICGPRRLAYVTTRDAAAVSRRWTAVDVAMADERDRLVDLVYDAAAGKAYCVTAHGDVHVFHGPGSSCRRRRPRVSPLHPQRGGAGLFAPPYDAASRLTGAAKSVFLSGGSLYQVWRNAGAAVSWGTPAPEGGAGRITVAKDEVFVLKYDPNPKRRRPCWAAVNDLGGCAVFVGKNSPVVLRPEDASGVRPNCVYWINEESRFQPMVFDMATRKSTPLPLAGEGECSAARRPLCWFFLNDKVASIDGDGSKIENDA
ncbi:unnamed protein product [Urochloa humidicola]